MKKFPGFTISTHLILNEALSRSIEINPMKHAPICELTFKGHTEYIFRQLNSITTIFSEKACVLKWLTKEFLSSKGISVAKGSVINSLQGHKEILKIAHEIGFPLVIKPTSSSHGSMVEVVYGESDLKEKVDKIFSYHKSSIIEKLHQGVEYRIFATKEKVIAITNRVPANIVGNGRENIKELVDKKNSDPRRGPSDFSDPEKNLVKIEIDDHVLVKLESLGLNLDYVPKNGEQVFLRDNSNISTGGDSIDCTDIAHDSVKEIAIRAINAIPSLQYGGVDFLTKDITKEQGKDDYIIIEINNSPCISMHHFPAVGKSRIVAKEIIDLLFPETKK